MKAKPEKKKLISRWELFGAIIGLIVFLLAPVDYGDPTINLGALVGNMAIFGLLGYGLGKLYKKTGLKRINKWNRSWKILVVVISIPLILLILFFLYVYILALL